MQDIATNGVGVLGTTQLLKITHYLRPKVAVKLNWKTTGQSVSNYSLTKCAVWFSVRTNTFAYTNARKGWITLRASLDTNVW